jgi:acetyl esterase/lipase
MTSDSASAQASPPPSTASRIANFRELFPQPSSPAPPADETISFGSHPLQALDFWRAAGGAADAPLVVFIHGGGWAYGDKASETNPWRARRYTSAGYAFASVNYRLVPEARVEDQAHDVSAALKVLIAQASRLGIDSRRIILSGHSAGGHLSALLGTDESYLEAAGLSFADLAGVVPIDGAGYDVPLQIESLSAEVGRKFFYDAFGEDRQRQLALSPTTHARAPTAARFLIMHVDRSDSNAQVEGLAEALQAAGAQVQVAGFPDAPPDGHNLINQRIGDPDYEATRVLDSWLKELFGE